MKVLSLLFSTTLIIVFLLLTLDKSNLENIDIQSIFDCVADTIEVTNEEDTTTKLDDSEKLANKQELPTITKAVLYRSGVPEELELTDDRLIKMMNYIMCSIQKKNYGYVTGVLLSSDIEKFYKPQNGMYLLLEFDSRNSEEFHRYDCAIISGKTVVFIDSDSESYHGEGNPFNKCITPYYEDYDELDSIPDILSSYF